VSERTVAVNLKLLVADYVANARVAAQSTADFKDELAKSKDVSKKLSDGMLVTGGALAGGFLLAAKAAADFDQQMSHVNAVTNGSATELQGLRQAAISAGKDTQYSATQAAQAEEELAKAGLSTSNIIGGGLTGALNLAAAGSLDLAQAADISAKAMNTFGLRGSDVPHIADVLAAAANKSATDVGELGQALKQGGLAARNSGLTFEQTAGVLSAFADRALVGSDAGTSLKTMLQALANPTKQAAETMHRLGISAYDSQGNFVGLAKFADTLQTALGKLTQEQRNAALATIFGSDATRAATVLYELGSSGVNTYVNAVNDSGAAAETARKKTDNLAGDIERLKGSLETVAIQAGSGTNSGLRTLTKTAGAAVDVFGSLPGPIQQTITVLAGVSGASLLAAGGLLKVQKTTKETLDAISGMGPAGEKAAGGIRKFGSGVMFASTAVLAIGAAFGAAELISHLLGLDKNAQIVKRDVDALGVSLMTLAQTGKTTGELKKAFGPDMTNLHKQVDDAVTLKQKLDELNSKLNSTGGKLADAAAGGNFGALQAQYDRMLGQFRENIDGVDKALANMVNNGNATQARIALEDMAKASGMSIQGLINMMPQYQQAISGAAASNTGLAQGFGNAQQNASTLKQSMDELISAGESVMGIFNQLNGAAIGVSDAEIAAENAARSFKKALEDSGGSLDITTEKGGAARSALNDLAKKAAQAGQAVYNQTGSAQAAAAEIGKYRQKMIDAAIAAGMARDKAQALADSLLSMPKAVPITITTRYQTIGNPTNVYNATTGQRKVGNSRNPNEAHGGVLQFFDDGGFSGAAWSSDAAHVAQIAPAGAWRTWAEPETGGEGYIPLAMSKRARSTAILADINRRFGYPLGGGQPAAVELNPHFDVHLTARDPAGLALLNLIDVQIRRADVNTARAVDTGMRT
jgi:TP901 family phage tail tape measure protein